MPKFTRFLFIVILYVLTLMFFYSIIPFMVWVFGGSFLAVAQSPVYVIFSLFLTAPLTGFLFGECFDSEFYAKQ